MKNWQTAIKRWQGRIMRADFLSTKKRRKKNMAALPSDAPRFTFFPSLLNIPTSATLLFTPKSPSSFLCSVRPDWSGVIDEEHRFGRALITLLVIRTSWINDRREGEGYRALEFRTKPLWRRREDKEREGKVKIWEKKVESGVRGQQKKGKGKNKTKRKTVCCFDAIHKCVFLTCQTKAPTLYDEVTQTFLFCLCCIKY